MPCSHPGSLSRVCKVPLACAGRITPSHSIVQSFTTRRVVSGAAPASASAGFGAGVSPVSLAVATRFFHAAAASLALWACSTQGLQRPRLSLAEAFRPDARSQTPRPCSCSSTSSASRRTCPDDRRLGPAALCGHSSRIANERARHGPKRCWHIISRSALRAGCISHPAGERKPKHVIQWKRRRRGGSFRRKRGSGTGQGAASASLAPPAPFIWRASSRLGLGALGARTVRLEGARERHVQLGESTPNGKPCGSKTALCLDFVKRPASHGLGKPKGGPVHRVGALASLGGHDAPNSLFNAARPQP